MRASDFVASNERLLSLRPYGLLATLADRTSSLEPAHDGFLLPNSLEPESLRAQWDMLRRQTKNYADGTFCGATVLVNMRDIEALKEDDGFEGAFLSP